MGKTRLETGFLPDGMTGDKIFATSLFRYLAI
jgi:hypothetical protein